MHRDCIIVGLPKGRFLENTLVVVRHFAIDKIKPSATLSFRGSIGGRDAILKILKMSDIARLLEVGELDLGILCDEWICEHQLPAFSAEALNWCQTSLVLAVPVRSNRVGVGQVLRIATRYPRLARRLLAHEKHTHSILPVDGSAEALVPEIVDGILDCVETGRTLAANGLVPITWFAKGNVRVVATRLGKSDDLTSIGHCLTSVARRALPPIASPMSEHLLELVGPSEALGTSNSRADFGYPYPNKEQLPI